MMNTGSAVPRSTRSDVSCPPQCCFVGCHHCLYSLWLNKNFKIYKRVDIKITAVSFEFERGFYFCFIDTTNVQSTKCFSYPKIWLSEYLCVSIVSDNLRSVVLWIFHYNWPSIYYWRESGDWQWGHRIWILFFWDKLKQNVNAKN